MAEAVFTVKDVMRYLRVGRSTAYALFGRADFPCFALGRKLLVTKDALDEWITAQAQKRAEE